jgi:DnaJ-class molecular chaperone
MKAKSSSVSSSDARFIGWQEMYSGDVYALYTITAAGHPSCGSTVTGKTLIKLDLKIPKRQHTKSKENISQIISNKRSTDSNELRSPICTNSGGHKKRID